MGAYVDGFVIPLPKDKIEEKAGAIWREHRDEVNAKVIADPRLSDTMNGSDFPFDFKRMAYGGFNVLVHA